MAESHPMGPTFTPRRIVIAYAVVGVLIGAFTAAELLRDRVSRLRWQADGTLNGLTFLPELRTDPRNLDGFPNGRPLSVPVKVLVGTIEGLPIILVSALVGLCWGYVHLKIREWIADPFGDINKLDYEELSDRACPHGMT
jgi:hypothetical protein